MHHSKALDLGPNSGPHYIALSVHEKRLGISDYFLNEDSFGKVHAEGGHKIHVARVTEHDLIVDTRFQLDFNTAFATGPVRPHWVAMKEQWADAVVLLFQGAGEGGAPWFFDFAGFEYLIDSPICTIMVYYGFMAAAKQVRRSVTIPPLVDKQIEMIAKRRRLSGNRVLVELLELGLEARKQKENAFFELAERFRNADDPEQVKQLGNELGRFVFGE